MDNNSKVIVTLVAKDPLAKKVWNEPHNKHRHVSFFNPNDDGVGLCQINYDLLG